MNGTEDIFKSSLQRALEVLRDGGVILYPTDTVWGLGCDAANTDAVKRIFEIKKRADSKSMLSLVDSDGMLQRYVKNVPDIAWELIDAAVNPLTIIYDEVVGISPLLIAQDGSAGFRITHERFSNALCRSLRKPVVSTSANISGMKTPVVFSDITDEIRNAVDYTVDYGRESNPARPSNIIKLTNSAVVTVIR